MQRKRMQYIDNEKIVMQFPTEIQYDYIKILSRNPVKSSERCRGLYTVTIICTDDQSR